MRTHFHHLLTALLVLTLSHIATAQVINGNFETQNHAPQGRPNVGGTYDDLSNWSNPITPDGADYLATNALVQLMNPEGIPFYGSFPPHSGDACVAIGRELSSFSHDQFVTQQVTLVPNHQYAVSFYALRRPGHRSAEKLMAAVNSTPPTGYTTATVSGVKKRTLYPAPYATVVSAPIADNSNWTQVTGTFIAPTSTSTTIASYLTIGYDGTLTAEDPALYSYNSDGSGDIYYAIDDVSLVDLGGPCDVALSSYLPLNFCTNQGPRRFRVHNPYPSGFTYFWEFFILDASGNLIPYRPRGLQLSNTTLAPYIEVFGSQFPAGMYSYRVRARYDALGCYTEWAGLYPTGDSFTVGENCEYTAADDVERSAGPALAGLEPSKAPSHPEAVPAVYPNPVAEQLTVPQDAEVVALLNSEGIDVRVKNVAGQLNVQHLPAGLYTLRLRQHGEVSNLRIEVKR